jgi:hypothetical protein
MAAVQNERPVEEPVAQLPGCGGTSETAGQVPDGADLENGRNPTKKTTATRRRSSVQLTPAQKLELNDRLATLASKHEVCCSTNQQAKCAQLLMFSFRTRQAQLNHLVEQHSSEMVQLVMRIHSVITRDGRSGRHHSAWSGPRRVSNVFTDVYGCFCVKGLLIISA